MSLIARQDAVKRVEAFTVLVQKRSTDGELLLSGTLPEAIDTCLSEDCSRFVTLNQRWSRYPVEIPSP